MCVCVYYVCVGGGGIYLIVFCCRGGGDIPNIQGDRGSRYSFDTHTYGSPKSASV